MQSLGPRPASDGSAIERLEPVDTDDLFKWEAVVKGRGLGGGYEEGRWLLEIEVPEAYPNAPPKVRFRTRVVGSNVDFEVCDFFLFAVLRVVGGEGWRLIETDWRSLPRSPKG